MLPICMVCLPNYLIIHQHFYVLMSRNLFYLECSVACFLSSLSLINVKMEASIASSPPSSSLTKLSVLIFLNSYTLYYPYNRSRSIFSFLLADSVLIFSLTPLIILISKHSKMDQTDPNQ